MKTKDKQELDHPDPNFLVRIINKYFNCINEKFLFIVKII